MSTSDQKPRIFIGSSKEGLNVARAVESQLSQDTEVTVWDEGTFGLGLSSLENLLRSLDKFDFAIMVLTPDDVTLSRYQSQPSPRDNVIFESGLFMASLGRLRAFVVHDPQINLKLWSDIFGITSATYDSKRSDKNIIAAVGPACTQIREAIKERGVRTTEAPTPNSPNDPLAPVLPQKSQELIQKVLQSGLFDIGNGRTEADRLSSWSAILGGAKPDTDVIILGRSLIDWSTLWREIQNAIQQKRLNIRIGLLNALRLEAIEKPVPSDWADKEVRLSMDRFRGIQVQPDTGSLEVYGLNFYLSHSFVAYTSSTDNTRHCIQEAGIALPKQGRPFLAIKDTALPDGSYATNLEQIYSRLLTPDRLLIRRNGTIDTDVSGELNPKLIDAKCDWLERQNKLLDESLRLNKLIAKWDTLDLLRGQSHDDLLARSYPVFRSLRTNARPTPSLCSAHYEITDRCNSKCSHCTRWTWVRQQEAPLKQIIETASRLVQLGVRSITIGGGEPLLHSKFPTVLTELRKLNLHLGVITNGLQMPQTHAETIAVNADWVRFSIDAVNEDAYRTCRGFSGGLGIATANLLSILHHRPETSKTPAVGVNFVVNRINVTQMSEMADFCDELGVDTVMFKMVHGTPSLSLDAAGIQQAASQCHSILARSKRRLMTNAAQFLQLITEDCLPQDIQNGCPVRQFQASYNLLCFVPYFFATVGADGYAYPCDYLHYDTRGQALEHSRKKSRICRADHLGTNGYNYPPDKIRPNQNEECGCCTRFYRFNRMLNDLQREYTFLAKKYEEQELERIFTWPREALQASGGPMFWL